MNRHFDSLKDRSDLNNKQKVQFALNLLGESFMQERQFEKKKPLEPAMFEDSSAMVEQPAVVELPSTVSRLQRTKQQKAYKAAVKGQANLSGSGGRRSGRTGFSGKTGGFCWVARKVYGEDNPKWQIFRSWLCTQAPKWLYKAYGKYGESFAEWLDGKERTQKIIRKWMDKRIQKYLDTQPKTAQEISPL